MTRIFCHSQNNIRQPRASNGRDVILLQLMKCQFPNFSSNIHSSFQSSTASVVQVVVVVGGGGGVLILFFKLLLLLFSLLFLCVSWLGVWIWLCSLLVVFVVQLLCAWNYAQRNYAEKNFRVRTLSGIISSISRTSRKKNYNNNNL